jgi:hypothetical protein
LLDELACLLRRRSVIEPFIQHLDLLYCFYFINLSLLLFDWIRLVTQPPDLSTLDSIGRLTGRATAHRPPTDKLLFYSFAVTTAVGNLELSPASGFDRLSTLGLLHRKAFLRRRLVGAANCLKDPSAIGALNYHRQGSSIF